VHGCGLGDQSRDCRSAHLTPATPIGRCYLRLARRRYLNMIELTSLSASYVSIQTLA
jgi:hypothetical protein